MSEKLWGGRFSEQTNHDVETFTSSIHIDKRLYPFDIEGSIAHCTMLAKQGIISDQDRDLMIQGLKKIEQDIDNNAFPFSHELEDIHMHIESRLTECIGDVAKKLHTARSRNDQVALDIRLYLRYEIQVILSLLMNVRKTLIGLAEQNSHVILPGYTHLQRAQPVLLAHHWLAYYEMFSRDSERFQDCYKRVNVMPLGSAALAGTTFPIDRQYTAELLNFPIVSDNSMDSVSDRDFILEFLSHASICMVHLSRFSEELVLWSSSEFSFIELSDAYTTGSSIMPQKKNPDVAELVRGKTGRVFGSLFALLTMMKGLPLAYNRDMQEDKEPLFDGVDTLKACLSVFNGMIGSIRVHEKMMVNAAQTGFLNATDLADYLVQKGMPFRDAHHCVGEIVKHCTNEKIEIHELPLNDLQTFSTMIQDDIYEALSIHQVVNRRTSYGGTSVKNVKQAIEKAKLILGIG